MAENREEVLSQLYALRAGMSYISEEVTSLKEREKENEEKIAEMREIVTVETYYPDSDKYGREEQLKQAGYRKELYDRNVEHYLKSGVARDICEARYKVAEFECGKINPIKQDTPNIGIIFINKPYTTCFPETVKFYEDKKAEYENFVNKIKQEPKRRPIAKNVFLYLLPIFIIMAIVGSVVDINGLMIGGIVTSVICGIGALVYLWLTLSINYIRSCNIKLGNAALESLEEAIAYFKERQARIDDLNQQIEILEEDAEGKTLQLEVYDKTNPLYLALVQTYSGIVDERDWQYLDLIIYYYETHRAESIKEALQLVDRQKQAEMIVNAVQEAERGIVASIYTATKIMTETIVSCCQQICNHIDSNAATVVNAVFLQNSLLKQSNRTSSQMAADIKYIKEKTDKISKNRN